MCVLRRYHYSLSNTKNLNNLKILLSGIFNEKLGLSILGDSLCIYPFLEINKTETYRLVLIQEFLSNIFRNRCYNNILSNVHIQFKMHKFEKEKCLYVYARNDKNLI